jgi:hypothetical protein
VHALTGPRPIPSQMLHPLSRFLTSDFLSHGHLHHYRIIPDLLFRLTHAHRIYVPLSFSHPSSIRPLLLCTHSRTCICSLRSLPSHCYPYTHCSPPNLLVLSPLLSCFLIAYHHHRLLSWISVCHVIAAIVTLPRTTHLSLSSLPMSLVQINTLMWGLPSPPTRRA